MEADIVRQSVEVLPLDSLEEMRSAVEEMVLMGEGGEVLELIMDTPPSSPPVSPKPGSGPAPLPRTSWASATPGGAAAVIPAAAPAAGTAGGPPPPRPTKAAQTSYASPAGATKMAPTSVLIGQDAASETRQRRMTLAVDLNEYKAQLEQNDLQTKKTQQSIKGIRGLVSKKKKRFIDSKYDLDLAYITDRLIAMGFPSEGREGIIRNPMSKVQQFFEERHANHYKVYNLCSERTYKTVAFRAPVAHFGFDDHNPPTLELLDVICKDVAEWLEFDSRNVAALHCLASDHELLTSEGFMGLSQLEARWDTASSCFTGELRVAALDVATQRLEYQTASQLVLNPGKADGELVEFVCEATGLCLRVTPEHDMLVQVGDEKTYSKRTALSLWRLGQERSIKARILTHAPKGHCSGVSDWAAAASVAAMGLSTERETRALMRVAGWWLGDTEGFLEGGATDSSWLRTELAALGWQEGHDFERRGDDGKLQIVNRQWTQLVASGNSWLWQLGRELARDVLAGLRMAHYNVGSRSGGSRKAAMPAAMADELSENREREEEMRTAEMGDEEEGFTVSTASPVFRDEVVRMALHAGMGACFASSTGGLWRVAVSEAESCVASVELSRLRLIADTGRTFCVTVPHGTIVARRVAEDGGRAWAAAVMGNCKAGKGRTGTVICAYLSHRYMHKGVTSQKALDFFAERRTHNKKGVTIASQIRWVHYYYKAKKEGIDFTQPKPLFLARIILHGAPNIDGKGGMDAHFVLSSKSRDLEFVSRTKQQPSVRIAGATEKFTFEVRCMVDKDVKLQFYKNDPKEKKEKLLRVFHVWFNTHFVEGPRLVLTLDDVDGIKKTKKDFPPSFAVEFVFEDPPQ